ncbi:MAG: MFS transporter [Hyphomicrobiales bacterium]
MVTAIRSVVGEYVREVGNAGRNPRLYLYGVFLIGLGQSVFSLLFNLYLRALGVSDAGIGQILSKGSLGAAVAAIPVAFVFRGISTRAILVAAGALVAALYALQVSVAAPELLLLLAFFSGMVVTVYRLSIAPVVMREVKPSARPFLFSASFSVLFVSAILGSALGGWLPVLFRLVTDSDLHALRWSLYVASGFTLLSAIPFNAMSEPAPETQAAELARAAAAGFPLERRLARAWQLIRESAAIDWGLNAKLMLPAFLIGLGAGLIIPFLNLFFRDRFHLSEGAIGLLFGVMQGFMVAGNLFGPAVSARLGLVRGVVATQLASVPFMVLLALSGSLPVVAGAFFLRGALMNMNQPLTSHFAMEMVPERDHAITNSLLSVAWFLSWTISADIGGALIERKGYTEPLLIAAALYVAASVLYWLFFRNVEEGRLPSAEVELPEA